jgi:hypothetical protein
MLEQVLHSTSQYLLVQIYLYPKQLGLFTGQIVPQNMHRFDWRVDVQVSVVLQKLQIDQIVPSKGSAAGGQIVEIFVSKLSTSLADAILRISFDDVESSILDSKLLNAEHGVLYVKVPPHGIGLSVISIHVAIPHAVAGPTSYKVNSPFLFFFQLGEMNLSCVKGCACTTNKNQLQTIVLILDSLSSSYLPSINLMELDFMVFSNYSDNESLLSIQGFNILDIQTCIQPQKCFEITINFFVDNGVAVQNPGTSFQGHFVLKNSADRSFFLSANVTFHNPPKLIHLVFSSDYTTLSIIFDQEALESLVPDCLNLLHVDHLGTNASCTWIRGSEMQVLLGIDSILAPGNILTLKAKITSIYGLSKADSSQSLVVLPPLSPILLRHSISGPNTVGLCDTATLLAAATLQQAVFSWGCLNDENLNSVLKLRTSGSILTIKATYLTPGKRYQITAEAHTPFGLISDTVVHILTLSSSNVPLLTIFLPPPPFVRSRMVQFASEIELSRCTYVQEDSALIWTLVEINSTESADYTVVLARSFGSFFQIPAGKMRANQDYKIFSTMIGSSFQQLVQAEIGFHMSSEPLNAIIAGGNRLCFIEGELLLDGTLSFDPDSCSNERSGSLSRTLCNDQSQLNFAWSCSLSAASPCLFKNHSVAVFQQTPVISLDLNTLDLDFQSELTVSLKVSTTGKYSLVSISIAVSPVPVVDVQIRLVYSTESGLAYQAEVKDLNAQFTWNIQAPLSLMRREFESADVSTFLSGKHKMYFILRLDTPWGLLNFQRGGVYSISLDVNTPSGSGSSWIEYTRPSPPSGGSCNISPLSGVALKTDFLMACTNWKGADLPLQYQYSVLLTSSHTDILEFVWSPISLSGLFNLYLPGGNFSVYSMITNAQGVHTISSSTKVSVKEESSSKYIEQPELSLFLSKLDDAFKISQLILLADAVSLTLAQSFLDPCLSSNCRRLMGSTKSYRMSIRRLLLRKLSGSVLETLSTVTSPSVMKVVKQISIIPDELDTDSVLLSLVLLEESCSLIGARNIRSKSLDDAVGLGKLLILSSRVNMNIESFEKTIVRIIHATLGSSRLYAASMLEGENPRVIDYIDVWLNVSYLSLRMEKLHLFFSASPTNWSSLINQTNMGISVMKIAAPLNVWNTDSTALNGPRPFRSEVVGISISDPDSQSTESTKTWRCPKEFPYCILVSLSFEIVQADLASSNLKLSCLRWTLDGWDDESCILKNITLSTSAISTQHTITCTCSSDGIFKSVLMLPQKTDSEFAMFPKTALRFHQAQESLTTVFISVTVLFLMLFSSMSLVLLCLMIIDSDKITPTAPNLVTSETNLNAKFVAIATPGNKSLHFSLTSLDLGFLPQFSDHFPTLCFLQHNPDDGTGNDVVSPISDELTVKNEANMQSLCFCMPQDDGFKYKMSEYEQKLDRLFGCEHPVHADGSWTALSFANLCELQRVPSGIYPLPLH